MNKFFLAVSLMLATVALSAQHKLTVTVDGIDKTKGKMFIAVYDEANYMKQPLYGTVAKVDTQEVTAVIDSVSAGCYAVVIFHDINDNGKLDMGAFGPTEPYGYSNNAKGQYGPPSFADCAIKVEDDTAVYVTVE
ncbi:MAG: DUF2141 domain-containing protein [Cytophagaceae bacterium]|jgi:uncharacterized protein (DUF2141 family)|nr:DUF2141 domain-containing protein [Cytophagaceae bacterium]